MDDLYTQAYEGKRKDKEEEEEDHWYNQWRGMTPKIIEMVQVIPKVCSYVLFIDLLCKWKKVFVGICFWKEGYIVEKVKFSITWDHIYSVWCHHHWLHQWRNQFMNKCKIRYYKIVFLFSHHLDLWIVSCSLNQITSIK